MSIRQVTVFTAQCDRCGRRTTDDWPGMAMTYPTWQDADADLIQLGWYSADRLDDLAVCTACRRAIDGGEEP